MPHDLIGASPAMALVRRMIAKAARNRLPVLLLGETGTGKEVVARGIFEAAPRGQFVPIDCGSLVGTLMESELFGNVKGAFTGAAENRKGLVEAADGGTAFFDEIGDLPNELQVKLLRLLQESEFRAVGSLHWRKVDLRIIAATHRDLKKEITAGRFREDLFFRLNVFSIRLPSLRQHMADVPVLVAHFLQQNREQGLPSFEPPRELLDAMRAYDWPGNVRELKHCIERMSAMYSEGAPFPDLPSALRYRQAAASALDSLSLAVDDREPELEFRPSPPLPVISIPDSERLAICAALAETKGERTEAARLLHIGRTTLYRKMKQYGVG